MAKLSIADKIKLSYAAGFVDADGCIMIQRARTSRSFHGVSHEPRVCAFNCKRAPLELFVELFGGKIQTFKRKVDHNRWKPKLYWDVRGHKAVCVARYLMPYLRRKGTQAYLLSCFEYESTWEKAGGTPEQARMPDLEFDRREKLYREMRGLNA